MVESGRPTGGSDQTVFIDQKAAYLIFDALEWAGAQSWIEDEEEVAAEYINTLMFLQEQFSHEFLENYHDFCTESNKEEAIRFGMIFREVSDWARKNNHPLKQHVSPENNNIKDTENEQEGEPDGTCACSLRDTPATEYCAKCFAYDCDAVDGRCSP